ncbi:MAG: hypothetical protein ACKVW3_04105 [Phycisphaerales bacterium]
MRRWSFVGAVVTAVMVPVVTAQPSHPRATPKPSAPVDPLIAMLGAPDSPTGPGFDLDWYTIDGGGATYLVGANGLSFGGTAGQPDAGVMSGGDFVLSGGFWFGVGGASCYANCDASTIPPSLNILDFLCFQNRYAAGDAYANCDLSTMPPILNVADFICFQNAFAAGCP